MNIEEKVRELNGSIINIAAKVITVQCLACNRIWNSNYKNLSRGNFCYCKRRKKFDTDHIKNLLLNINATLIDSCLEFSVGEIFLVQCNECNRQWQTCEKKIRNNHGCKSCIAKKSYKPHKNIKTKAAKLREYNADKNKQKSERKYRKLKQKITCDEKRNKYFCEANEIAKSRDGYCLSDEYISRDNYMEWKCKRGHMWKAPLHRIRYHWCPQCPSSLSEEICRLYLQKVFGKKFPKSRPDWLKNYNDRQLELDGLCLELNLGFEHHGKHHYELVKDFKMTEEYLKHIQENDRIKEKLCEDHGIKLIIIPALFSIIDINDIQQVVEKECQRLNVMLSYIFDKINIDDLYDIAISYCDSKKYYNMEMISEFAKNKEGEILSKEYIHYGDKLQWKCKKNHIFEMSLRHVVAGHWCGFCAIDVRASSMKQKNLNNLIEIAETKGGACLSNEYEGQRGELLWQCSKKHQWKMTARSLIERDTWCPICEKGEKDNKYLHALIQMALSKEGQLLSKKYLGANVYHIWQCKEKHTWKAWPSNILQGNWCPICAGRLNSKNIISYGQEQPPTEQSPT